MKSNVKKYIFTEDLDYTRTAKESIWGKGDSDTLRILKRMVSEKSIKGEWLHFASGDGRYNDILLSSADKVMATDIDRGALEKLVKFTPRNLAPHLTTMVQNITKPFPFGNCTFDGVFNTGTLHLFPAPLLENIINESARVLKPDGLFLFDFATDIKRVKKDGTLIGRTDVQYHKRSAKILLEKLLKKAKLKPDLLDCSVPPETVTSADGTYTFSCNYWFVIAEK